MAMLRVTATRAKTPVAEFEIVANSKAKSDIWKSFGFVKENDNDDVDNSRVACRLCRIVLKYSGNTTNLTDHMRRRHSSHMVHPQSTESTSGGSKSATEAGDMPLKVKQVTMGSYLLTKLTHNSSRAKIITTSIANFIVKDLRPFCVVENDGFKGLLHTLEPRYTVPSRQYFSETKIPKLYEEVKLNVLSDLAKSDMVALTTDAWTSRATESYVTITSCHITSDWQIRNYVLQTRAMPESHTGVNIAEVIQEAKQEWGLPSEVPIVTDNASNMVIAARESNCKPHIGCYAHTLNLASGKAFHIPQVSKLLARMRRIVAYFHRSCLGSTMLKEKQTLLNLPRHKLIIDVSTRWNSSIDMLARFLEQQPAIYAALTSKDLRGRDKDLSTLNETDISHAEEFVACMTPLKTATVALCEEKVPTLSIVLPLHMQLINETLADKENDSNFTKSVKNAVRENLSTRYHSVMDDLKVATLLDPRFKSTPFLTDADRLLAYEMLTVKASECFDAKSEILDSSDATDSHPLTDSDPPLPKLPESNQDVEDLEPERKRSKLESTSQSRSALATLFGNVYVFNASPNIDNVTIQSTMKRAETETSRYRIQKPIPLNENPLDWWKANYLNYPILSHLAKVYLCIPATSVPSERVFSTAGDIVTAQRSLLKSEHVDRLIFLKKNIK